jgi:LysM repeat protein
MSASRFLILVVLVLVGLGLFGCTLSASTPPPTSQTSDMSTLQAELGAIASQTVAAGGVVTIPTIQPAAGTVIPTAGASSVPTQVSVPPSPKPTKAPVNWNPTPGIPKKYEIQKGEFPFCIARRFNVDVGELLALNGLSVNSVVPVGYMLQIPQSGNTFNGQRALIKHPTDYTVASGDTIYTIGCKFGDVDPNAIIAVNGLKSPYTLKVGKSIYIP